MIATAYAAPRVVHAIPGRVRIHVPAWVDGAASRLDHVRRALGRLAGVRGVSLSALTGNALLHFDPGVTAPARLLGAIGRLLARRAVPAVAGDTPRERRTPRGRVWRASGRVVASLRAASLRGALRPLRREDAAGAGVEAAGAAWQLAGFGRALLSLMTSLRPARLALNALLGRRVGTLVVHLPGVLGVVRALASVSGPVSLAVAGLEAVQLMGEIGGALRAA